MGEIEFVRLGAEDDRDNNFDCGYSDLNEFFLMTTKGNCKELLRLIMFGNLTVLQLRTLAFQMIQ